MKFVLIYNLHKILAYEQTLVISTSVHAFLYLWESTWSCVTLAYE